MANNVAPAPLAERIDKIRDLTKGIDIAMMTTIDESGELHSRPMSTQTTDFDGTVWFFVYADAGVVKEIGREPRVNLGYAKPGDQTYLSLAGNAKLSTDRAKMEELYSPVLDAWFPQGLETPGIALIEVEATSAHYWDATSNPIAFAVGLVAAKVTGREQDYGEEAVFRLDGR